MQRRKPRILAAIGLTVGALALPSVAGASYIPDILNLGPDTGHRFNDGEPVDLDYWVPLDCGDTCWGTWGEPLPRHPAGSVPDCAPCADWLREQDDYIPPPDWWDGGDSVTETDYTDAQMTLRQYFSLDWGWYRR